MRVPLLQVKSDGILKSLQSNIEDVLWIRNQVPLKMRLQ